MATVGFIRPDVKEARAAVGRVKAALVYKDDDELDTGMQKVQPLPFLDEEILKFKKKIEDCLSAAQAVNDDVPEKVLSKVGHVIQVATEGKTTLFKASELLEFTLNAFQYARQLALDRFDLFRRSGQALVDSDHSFRQMMSARLEAKMETASQCEEDCLRHLELALKEAESDCGEWVGRSQEEEKQVELVGTLEELRGEVKESISDEILELEMIRNQCSKDARTIDSEMNKFKSRIEKTASEYKKSERENQEKLDKNKQDQEDLKRRLKKLKDEQDQLEEDLSAGQSQDQEAAESREGVEGEAREWRERVVELQSRADTSLKVMKEMAEVTELIVTDAQKKQRAFREKLSKLELESILTKRDVLMAQGVMYKLIDSESRDNITNIQTELADLEKEKKIAAKSNFRMKVEKVTQNIESYRDEKAKFDDKSREAQDRLQTISKELANMVDARLKQLQPSLKLDKIEERYSHRKASMEKAFSEESLEGVQFTSKGRY